MNYLSHIQLAHCTNTSLLGNFLGDFVKGSDLSFLDESLRLGVQLHRSIDSFTDQHPLISNLRTSFPRTLRRMSGVIIDIYFDHLLCVNWAHYNSDELNQVLELFYTKMANSHVPLEGRYQLVKKNMLAYKWLASYMHSNACNRAFEQIEKRLQYKILFSQQATHYVSEHHEQFNDCFNQFYPILMTFCEDKAADLAQ